MNLWSRNKRVDRAEGKMISTMVVNATQPLQMGVDWTAVTAISDQLRQEESTDAPAAFVKAVVARLRESARVQLLTLRLLESVMKNAGHDIRIPRAVATKELMAALAALASNKQPRPGGLFNFRCANSNLGMDLEDGRRYDHEAQELARVLLRSWAEGFAGVEAEVPLFNTTYMTLLRSGLGFPELSSEERTVFKLRSPFADEVEGIAARVRLLEDMLTQPSEGDALSPRCGVLSELGAELCVELDATREDLQRRIPRLDDEEALALYLNVLSMVEDVLQRCWRQAEEGSQVADLEADPAEASSSLQVEQHRAEPKDSELSQFAPDDSLPDAADDRRGQIGASQDQSTADIADLLGLAAPPSVA